jgi:uncharacterized protein YdcH (DUF465 family)
MQGASGKKYIFVFFITLAIFVFAIWLSEYFSNRKIEQLRSIQESISIDILSSETQFSLLSELSCKDVSASTLSNELNTLAEKIEFSEKNLGNENEISQLKKYYSLLEIKDYLLMQQITERCNEKLFSILYFYTTANNCSECVKQSYVLTELRATYPELRVYSFDYNLDLSALRALVSIYGVEDTKLPALIVGDEMVTGFRSIEEIEAMLPELVKIREEREAKALEDAKQLSTQEETE